MADLSPETTVPNKISSTLGNDTTTATLTSESETEENVQAVNVSPLPAPPQSTKEAGPEESNRESLTLKGIVKEKTWMRVVIDNQEPKEYIFNPGSQPQWEARKNFDIMIGNAAGITLEFNGTDLGPLGPRGKVVHLRLPKE